MWWLQGGCSLRQGGRILHGEEIVLWVQRREEGSTPADWDEDAQWKVIAYVEGGAEVASSQFGVDQGRIEDDRWLGRLYSNVEPDFRVARLTDESSDAAPTVRNAFHEHRRAPATNVRPLPPATDQHAATAAASQAEKSSQVQPAQFSEFLEPAGPGALTGMEAGARRFRIRPRSGVAPNLQVQIDEQAGETIVLADKGWRLIVDGYIGDAGAISAADLAADRIFIWYGSTNVPNLAGDTLDDGTIPLEVYLEGNIEFRQGQRVIYAERMYYDLSRRQGIILDVELQTPAPEFDGKIRLRAEVLQQLNDTRFLARDAMLTSSRIGEPRYWFQSQSVQFEDVQTPRFDGFGQPVIDPATQSQVVDHQRLAASNNNFLYVGNVPVLYWPRFATDLEDPTFYLKNLRVKNDGIFGTQILTDWDAYQLLGIKEPLNGTEWDVSADYLSERGPAGGTSFTWQRDDFFGLPSPNAGFIDAWGIMEEGLDSLGSDRLGLDPLQDFRGRVLGRHRQQLPWDLTLSAEVGYASDRNFRESYFENEWDRFKDQTTGVELKQLRGSQSWSIAVDARLDDFYTQTEQLPRADHFLIGQSVFGSPLIWHEHTHVGYSRLKTADPPKNPAELGTFTLLPWEAEVNGEVLATRHELELPLLLGPVKASPFVLGEFARWGETLDGTDVDRLYGRAGVRSSLPMWGLYPNVDNTLFNVHGVAHKLTWYSEFAFSEADADLTDLAFYEPLDDDNIEQFRRRFQFLTFGGVPAPAMFDPRFYALRSGLGGHVTSPSTEVADDLMTLQLGLRQRLQTKRGPLGGRRIIDWMVLDVNAIYFPKDDRDNFGQPIGLLRYDYRWHVGDRLTILSDGVYDFFDMGQQISSVGAILNRPSLGSLYVGFRNIQGPIDAEVISAAYSYRLSQKWISTAAATFDIGDGGNIGQRFGLTRVGESLLFSLGFNVDASRDNVGIFASLEPRFLPGALSRRLGAATPRYGEYGFE